MNISDKDKQVLIIVGAVLLIFASWFFGFRNFSEQTKDYKAQTAVLENRYNELLKEQEKKPQYIADTAIYNEDAAKILTEYADGHSLENTIKYIYEMEDNTETFISNFSISDGQLMYAFSDGTKQGIVVPINFTYEATYDTMKTLIDYINSFETKCSINDMSISYDADEDVSTGTVNMNLFAVITPESVEPEVEIDMPIGNENMFMATTVYESDNTADKGEYIIDDHDVLVEIVNATANAPSVSVGLTDSGDAPITTDANGEVEIEIVVGGSEGQYTISYKVGNDSYPSKNYDDGVLFEPGDTIDILVSSTSREGDDDKVTGNFVFINESDKTLNVKVIDDEEAERFNVVEKDGKVKVYR